MNKQSQFKQQYTEEERIEKAKHYQLKYPLHMVVIVEKYHKSQLPTLKKVQYLIRKDVSFAALKAGIKESLKLSKNDALFIFCGRNMINESEKLQTLQAQYKDSVDGFLYFQYADTDPFGY